MGKTIRPTAHIPAPIVYPESDGEPMADNTLQFKWIVLIKENLERCFRDDPLVFIAGDLLWYPIKQDNVTCMAPDAMVVFGRPKGYRGSYVQCLEGDVPPQVVFEVLSPSNRPSHMKRKRAFYLKHGVEEYYEYYPNNGDLRGWLREHDTFVPVERMAGFTSPRLGIRFEPGAGGPDALAIIGPDGQPFRTLDEHAERADAEKRQADAQRRRADAEKRQADAQRRRATAADQRAERLAAKLRELGIDPHEI